jgi:hypothetical protein
MRLPKTFGLGALSFVIAIVGTLLVAPTLLTAYHLIHWRETTTTAIIVSFVWLMLLGLLIAGEVSAHRTRARLHGVSLKQRLKALLGAFARKHFVDHTDGKLQFGFQLFKRTWVIREIPSASVVSVEWSAGQASGMSGRDCNDWRVWLWHLDHSLNRKPMGFPQREESLSQVGDEGSKAKMSGLGLKFVDFLRDGGIDLKPTVDPTQFTITGEPPVWIKPNPPARPEGQVSP